MAKLNINTGASDNDKSGDTLRTAFTKINANFTELYATASADVQIPAQGSNSGKYLTTNGTALSWGTVSQDRLVNGSFNFILGPDGTVNFDPSSANGKGILQTAADLQFIAVDKTWTFDSSGSITFPDATVQTTAALPYVKTAYNVVNATATMDTITVSWISTGSGNHVQYSTLSSSDVTYAYSGMNIIAGVTTSFNSAGTYVMNAANYPDPPWFYGIFNTIGDVQIVYMQDITNSKTYRITATATSTYTGAAARGSILIERII